MEKFLYKTYRQINKEYFNFKNIYENLSDLLHINLFNGVIAGRDKRITKSTRTQLKKIFIIEFSKISADF